MQVLELEERLIKFGQFSRHIQTVEIAWGGDILLMLINVNKCYFRLIDRLIIEIQNKTLTSP